MKLFKDKFLQKPNLIRVFCDSAAVKYLQVSNVWKKENQRKKERLKALPYKTESEEVFYQSVNHRCGIIIIALDKLDQEKEGEDF